MDRRLKVYLETSFVSYLTGRPTTKESIAAWQAASRQWWTAVAPSCDLFVSEHVWNEIQDGAATPMDEIYAVRQKISASYNHDPHLYFKAMVERQKERARQGRVYWGYNAAGEFAPIPLEAMLAR